MTQASYDSDQHRWVPVPREWVSPDGSSYAYAVIQPGAAQGVHIVDVRTGSDRVIPGTSGDPDARGSHFGVVAYQLDGVYLNRVSQLGANGLWLLNPTTGAITQVSTDAPGVNRQSQTLGEVQVHTRVVQFRQAETLSRLHAV